MWQTLIASGHTDAELREFDLKKMLKLYKSCKRVDAEADMRQLTNFRAAVASVMGGKDGHKMFVAVVNSLKKIMLPPKVTEKASRKAFMSKLVAFGAKKKRKESA